MNNLEENSIVVVCSADDNYAMPLSVTMRSVIENLKGSHKITFFIIDGGIRERNKRKIIKSLNPQKCDVRWIDQPDAFLGKFEVLKEFVIEDVPGVGTITHAGKPYLNNPAVYYRLLIADLLPKNLRKAIYLDCDLIVTGNIGELWNVEIGDNYLLAVQELLTPYVSSHAGLINYRELGIPQDAKYFNSGVLVIDLEKWRDQNLTTKLVEYLRHNGQYVRWADTDVLNAVLAGKWGELDPKWNQTPSIYAFPSWEDWSNCPLSKDTYDDVRHNPYIVHFSTGGKPWNSYQEHPFRHLFFHYLDMTAWSGWRLTIWRRLQRRLIREIQKLGSFVAPPKTLRSPS